MASSCGLASDAPRSPIRGRTLPVTALVLWTPGDEEGALAREDHLVALVDQVLSNANDTERRLTVRRPDFDHLGADDELISGSCRSEQLHPVESQRADCCDRVVSRGRVADPDRHREEMDRGGDQPTEG